MSSTGSPPNAGAPKPLLTVAASMPPEMLSTLLLSFGAIGLLFVTMLRARWRLARGRAAIADLKEVG